MAELGEIQLWRLHDKVELGHIESKKQPDTTRIKEFVTDLKLHCAQYRVTDRMILANAGLNDQNTIVVAVRHKRNRDYGTYKARFKGEIYNVTLIKPDPSLIVTYDLISLKLVDKNG